MGTSGWLYDWNAGGSLEWYIEHSGLDAVELNASFYRFPFPRQVGGWAGRSLDSGLRWAVKVHRSITHYRRLSGRAIELWGKFKRLFEPLEETGLLDFYLFQMPPSFSRTKENVRRVEDFLAHSGLEGWRFALELRHDSWFNDETVEWARRLGITIVSVDAPIASWIVKSDGIIYLRMHGRRAWYNHDYTQEELEVVVSRIKLHKPDKVYVFFNNDHWMLSNARVMKHILGRDP